MSNAPQPLPRNIPIFKKHKPLWVALQSALCNVHLLYTLWQVIIEQIGLESGCNTTRPEALEQERMAWVRSWLDQRGISPMDQLLYHIQSHIPALTTLLGKYAKHTLRQIMLVHLGLLDESQAELRTERITPDNPITIDAYYADRIQVTIPRDVTGRHFLELSAYVTALRPTKPRGRRPKLRDAPPQSPRGTRDPAHQAKCLRAWVLDQQGQNWQAIARDLWPNEKLPADKKKRERIRKKVGRLVYAGRQLDTTKKVGREKLT